MKGHLFYFVDAKRKTWCVKSRGKKYHIDLVPGGFVGDIYSVYVYQCDQSCTPIEQVPQHVLKKALGRIKAMEQRRVHSKVRPY